MRALKWLLALVAVFLVATAVAAVVFVAVEGETEVEAGAPQAARPWPRCESAALGYSIAYPPGWHRDRNCAFFDPKPFTVPENSDFYGAALEVQVAQDSWENVVRGLTDERFGRTINRRELQVNGRRAVLAEVEATGQGLYERGYTTYAYVVDVAGRAPVIVQATRRPGTVWGTRKRVADRAVRSLRV
jgi:hypothetical protein